MPGENEFDFTEKSGEGAPLNAEQQEKVDAEIIAGLQARRAEEAAEEAAKAPQVADAVKAAQDAYVWNGREK